MPLIIDRLWIYLDARSRAALSAVERAARASRDIHRSFQAEQDAAVHSELMDEETLWERRQKQNVDDIMLPGIKRDPVSDQFLAISEHLQPGGWLFTTCCWNFKANTQETNVF